MRTRFPNAGAIGGAPLAVLVALAWPAAAAAAPSGSIVFTRSANVYRAHADGSGARRITRDGTRAHPYKHPSQADNGTIVAVRDDTTLYRFSRSGRRLGRPRRVASGLRNEGSLHDLALWAAISPNGREVALQNTLLQGIYNPTTGVRGMNLLSITIEYRSAATGRKLGERHVPGDYLESPSWVDNRRVLFFKPLVSFSEQVNVDTRGGQPQPWFADELGGEPSFERQHLDEGEITRAQDKIALIRGTNIESDWRGSTIQIYKTAGLSQMPQPACTIAHAGSGPFAKPTWSPDGSTLAWSDGRGIWSSSVSTSIEGCELAPRRILSGGVAPDWGPAR